MSRSTSLETEKYAFIATLAQQLPAWAPHTVAVLGRKILRLAGKHGTWALNHQRHPLRQSHLAEAAKVERTIRKLLPEGWEATFGGDPELESTVVIHLPNEWYVKVPQADRSNRASCT